jgi:hypothetical protein
MLQPQPQSKVISIKEARKLLPKKLERRLSDDEVEHIVVKLEAIAREFIRLSVPKN